MPLSVIDALRALLFGLAHVCGGSLGAAIVVAAVALRVAMLPLSLPAAKRRVRRELKVRAMTPELEAIKRRFAKQPEAMLAATRALHESHGVPMLDRAGFRDAALQIPPASALYAAVRAIPRGAGRLFWVADITSPSSAFAIVAAIVSAVVVWATAASQGPRAAQVVPAVVSAAITLVILWHLSAGIALYSVVNSIFGGLETSLARRLVRSGPA